MGQGKGAPETGRPFASGPFGERRQAHQDRIDIAAGLEAEQRAAAIDEVDFGIAAAPDQLLLPFGVGSGEATPATPDLREEVQEVCAATEDKQREGAGWGKKGIDGW